MAEQPPIEDWAPARRAADLTTEHRWGERIYRRFLEALVDRDLAAADRLLDRYAAWMVDHIGREEGEWLPRFDEHFGTSRGFGADLVLQEHRVIEKLLNALRDLVSTLAARGERLDASGVLTLLEDAFRFRGVVNHHHAREDNVVIPALQELEQAGTLRPAAEETSP